jgi:hypothetical protein
MSVLAGLHKNRLKLDISKITFLETARTVRAEDQNTP